jgi:hypothetical protein
MLILDNNDLIQENYDYSKYNFNENAPRQIENHVPSRSKEKNLLVNSNSSGNLSKIVQKNKNQKFISSMKKKI